MARRIRHPASLDASRSPSPSALTYGLGSLTGCPLYSLGGSVTRTLKAQHCPVVSHGHNEGIQRSSMAAVAVHTSTGRFHTSTGIVHSGHGPFVILCDRQVPVVF